MTRAERLAILGAADVTESRRLAAAAPPPPPELVEELRHIFAPTLARRTARRAAALALQAA